MRPLHRSTCAITPVALLLALLASAQLRAETYIYGVEVNDVLCGYAEVHVSSFEKDGRPYTLVRQEIVAMLSVFGSEVNQNIELIYHVDPATGEFTYHENHIVQGDVDLRGQVVIEGNEARCTSSLVEDETIVPLPDGVILTGPLHQVHLQRDFSDGQVTRKTYEVFEEMESAVQTVTITRAGTETLELAGETHEAIIFEQLNQDTGLKARLWLDSRDFLPLKIVISGRRIYLTDPSVKKRIELVNVDETITAKTNVSIADVQGISFMKVQATIEPTGLWLTPEDLNVPGQRFVGTVEENLIQGVFEIEHSRYDGAAAPPYPADFGDDASLQQYLEPEDVIESDDPVLVERARSLAAGSADSWEAARRLSQWVARNIDYVIPGGATPRKTYDIRAGECGAHSMLLATFCRAVGIPARVVWGCMYIPNFGGAFGQHAWTEVYMGDAGWVPVDATAYETDFVDSGHIRLGVYQSRSTALNARTMEVLEYRLIGGETGESAEVSEAKYAAYLGQYDSPAGGPPFTVLVKDGQLALDIPNQMALPLNDPDEDGRWYCKLTPMLFCEFPTADDGSVREMLLHEIVRMQRRSEPDPAEIGDDVPEDLRPYLGGYYFAAARAEFKVIWADGSLAVHNPLEQRDVQLRPTDVEGSWIDEFDKNIISFVSENGTVSTLVIDARNSFPRR